MIFQFMVFLVMVAGGGVFWWFLNYLIDIFINVNVTMFPDYAGLAHATFMGSYSSWGLLILCLIPAAIYLWMNTQKPGVPM